MRRFFQFLVESNLWVSAAIAALLASTAQMLGVETSWRAPFAAFCVAMAVYTWDHRQDFLADTRHASAFMTRYYGSRQWLFTTFAALLGAIIALWGAATEAWLGVSGMLFAGVAHGTPILPRNGSSPIRMKDIRGAKAWIVSVFVALGAVIGPIVFARAYAVVQPTEVLVTILFIFALIACNAHTFDIRDIEEDRRSGLRTLPMRAGVRRARMLLHGLNGAAGLLLVLAAYLKWTQPHLELLLWVLGTGIYLAVLKPDSARLRYDLLVDGALFLSLAIIFLNHNSLLYNIL